MGLTRVAVFCLAAGGLAANFGAARADDPVRHPLTVADFDRVQHVSDPRVSPDGSWVAYLVTTADRDADEERSAVWMVGWDGSQRVQLTRAANGTEKPRWSPDGRFISFLAPPSGTDKPQLMLLDRRGGEALQLTNVDGDLGDYAWSPDGRRVVIVLEQADAPVQRGADKGPKPS